LNVFVSYLNKYPSLPVKVVEQLMSSSSGVSGSSVFKCT